MWAFQYWDFTVLYTQLLLVVTLAHYHNLSSKSETAEDDAAFLDIIQIEITY